MRRVLQRPPSDSCKSRVSFESRYGMRSVAFGPFFSLSRSIEMTRPNVSKLVLMFLRSRSRSSFFSPGVPAVLAHSDPARSTRLS